MKSQWMVRDKFRSTFWIIFTTSILPLFGCSVTVPFEKRIPLLSDSIQKGEQVTNDVKITYTYRLVQKTSDLSGLLEIEGNAHSKHDNTVNRLRVWIDFFDNEGKVLERRRLIDTGYHPVIKGQRFKEKLKVPTGTVGISFAAEGRVLRPKYRPNLFPPSVPPPPPPPPNRYGG